MAELKTNKVVSSLPGTLEANAVYFVRVGSGFDLYATNGSGTVVAYSLNIPVFGSLPTVPTFADLPASISGSNAVLYCVATDETNENRTSIYVLKGTNKLWLSSNEV